MRKSFALLGLGLLTLLVPANAALVDPPSVQVPDHRHALPGPWEAASCGGTAPALNQCATGLHTRAGSVLMGPGDGSACTPFDPSEPVNTCDMRLPGFRGTMMTQVAYIPYFYGPLIVPYVAPSGPRWRLFHFDGTDPEGNFYRMDLRGAEVPQLLTPAGSVAAPVTLMEHTCRTFELETETPGGSGPWTCFVYHNVLQ